MLRLHVRGHQDSLRNITREDLTAHHRQYTTAANAGLSVVGDVDIGLVERVFSRLASHSGGIPSPQFKRAPLSYTGPINKILAKEQTIYRLAFETVGF